MAAEQLQIQVSANVSNAIKGLGDLEKGLKSTETAGAKLGNSGLPQVAKGANQANIAMINLGRTVSDAPFGFIGIANNIGPLIENFASLKKEAGTTGGALKQLGSSLIGPGGLIVGVQLAVAAVQFIQLGFSRWTGSTKKQKEETEKLNDSLDQIANTLAKENFEISRLTELINRQTATRSEQLAAYKKLNEIAPEFFGKLNTEKNLVEQTANAYFLYQNTLLNTFRIKAQEEELVKISKEQLDVEKQLLKIEQIAKTSGTPKSRVIIQNENKELITQDFLLRQRFDLQQKYNKLLSEIPKIDPKELKLPVDNKSKEQTLQDKINELLSDYRNTLQSIKYEEQIRGLNLSNQKLETNLDFLKRAADLVGFTGQAYKTIAKDTEEFVQAASNQKIVDVIKAYQTAISELDIKQAVTGQDQLNARVNSATDALIKLKTLGVQETNEEFIKLQNTLNGLQTEVGLREIRKRTEEIKKTWERFQLQINKLDFNKTKEPLDALKSRIDLIGNAIQELKAKGLTDKDLGIGLLNIQFEQLSKQFEKLTKQKELYTQLAGILTNEVGGAIDNVFDAFQRGEDVFQALNDSINQLVINIAKAVVKTLLLKAIANAIAPGSGSLINRDNPLLSIRADYMRNFIMQ